MNLLGPDNESIDMTSITGKRDVYFLVYDVEEDDVFAREANVLETYVTHGAVYSSKQYGKVILPINWSILVSDGETMVVESRKFFRNFCSLVFNPLGGMFPVLADFRWIGITDRRRWYSPALESRGILFIPLDGKDGRGRPCIAVSPDWRPIQIDCSNLL